MGFKSSSEISFLYVKHIILQFRARTSYAKEWVERLSKEQGAATLCAGKEQLDKIREVLIAIKG